MKRKTFREYLTECRFEDIWAAIAENFSEPDEIKPVCLGGFYILVYKPVGCGIHSLRLYRGTR